MINAETLNSLKLKELAELASSLNLTGWTRLSKSQLREFLLENAAKTSATDVADATETTETSAPLEAPKEPKKRRASKPKQPSLLDVVDAPETVAAPGAVAEPAKIGTETKEGSAPTKKRRASKKATETGAPQSNANASEADAPAKKQRKPRASKKKNAEPASSEGAGEATVSNATAPEEAKVEPTASPEADEEKPVEKAPRKRRAKAKQGETAQDAAPKIESWDVESTKAESNAPTADEAKGEEKAAEKKPRAKRGRKSAKATDEESQPTPAAESALETDVAASEEAQETTTAEPAPEVKPKRARKARAKKEDAATIQAPTNREEAKETASAHENVEKKKTAERIVDQTASREREKTDRIALAVCDPYWLRACWEISSQLVERVRSAMGRRWHASSLAIRLFEVDREQQSAVVRRTRVEDLVVKREIDNWYVQVDNPPRAFMVELGFLARDGEFFTLVSSNTVETPQRFIHDPFSRPVFGEPGIYDQRFYPRGADFARGTLGTRRRPNSLDLDLSAIERSGSSRFGEVDDFPQNGSNLQISLDAEIIVKGKTTRGARVSVKDKPIRVTRDGEFFARFTLPERRHVFPVVAVAPDDSESQTVILAVDRNTKTLDPVYKEDEE